MPGGGRRGQEQYSRFEIREDHGHLGHDCGGRVSDWEDLRIEIEAAAARQHVSRTARPLELERLRSALDEVDQRPRRRRTRCLPGLRGHIPAAPAGGSKQQASDPGERRGRCVRSATSRAPESGRCSPRACRDARASSAARPRSAAISTISVTGDSSRKRLAAGHACSPDRPCADSRSRPRWPHHEPAKRQAARAHALAAAGEQGQPHPALELDRWRGGGDVAKARASALAVRRAASRCATGASGRAAARRRAAAFRMRRRARRCDSAPPMKSPCFFSMR